MSARIDGRSTVEIATKNIIIVLQNIVTFRADWKYLASHAINSKLFLITGHTGNANLSESNKCAFSEHIVCDEFDYDNVRKACETIFKKENCTDFSQVRVVTNDEYFLGLAAQIRDCFGIAGIAEKDILPFINKIIMKQVVSKSGVRVPDVIEFNPGEFTNNADDYLNDIEKKLGYPVFAKQVDSAGSENVAKIFNRWQLHKWCVENKLNLNYEIDEFIKGDLYHIDILIKDGAMIERLICKYSCPNADFLDGVALGSVQIRKSDHEFEILSQATIDILAAFERLPDGAIHLEVFLTKDNQVVFVEIAARAPGGWVPQMHQLARGYNIEEQHFLLQMNLFRALKIDANNHSAWIWFPQKEGMKVRKVEPQVLTSKVTITWDLDDGEVQKKPTSVRDKVCGILLENEEYIRLQTDYKKLLEEFNPYK
jgi:hypothetical protein